MKDEIKKLIEENKNIVRQPYENFGYEFILMIDEELKDEMSKMGLVKKPELNHLYFSISKKDGCLFEIKENKIICHKDKDEFEISIEEFMKDYVSCRLLSKLYYQVYWNSIYVK